MSKRNALRQKIDSLTNELKKLEELEKIRVGEFMIDLYQKNSLDLNKINIGIAKILGEEVSVLGKNYSETSLIRNAEARVNNE